MSEIKPVAWVKDTSIVALQRDETTVLAYPYDYLIRPAVPLYTADALAAARDAALEEAAKVCEANRDPESSDAYSHGWDQCAQTCADAIRALKGDARSGT